MEHPAEHNKTVADFYDGFTKTWEILLGGDHLHNGFYDPNTEAPPKTLSEYTEAQLRLIQEAFRFAGFSDERPEKWPKNVVDVGCGLGGSSRYLARKYGAKCQGITLSPYEAQRATELTTAQGLADKVSFQVADGAEQPFPDGHFDLVLTIECIYHANDKKKFTSELARVAAPGATMIIITFCRPEESLQTQEEQYLKKISDAHHLPEEWYSANDYVKLLEALSLQDIKVADWSQNIASLIPALVRSFFTWRGLKFMWHGGLKTIIRSPLGNKGSKPKFVVIACRKPECIGD